MTRKRRLSNAVLAVLLPGLAAQPGCSNSQGTGRSSAASSTESAPSPSAASSLASSSAAEPERPGTALIFEVRDAATHAPMPGKVTIVGVDGTPSPSFTPDDLALERDRTMRAWNRVLTLSGEGRVDVPRGKYDIYVSRGPEWSLDLRRGVELGAHEVTIASELVHEVETPGWMSGDFHVHAEKSWDSKVPMKARVYEFIAEGVDLMVSTDHNYVSDYGPVVREMAVTDLIATLRGDEITTRDWGHFGAFPLPYDEGKATHGAFATKARTPTEIFRDVREHAPGALIDVNHPRFDRGLGYFKTGLFDREQAKFGRAGGSVDFDAIEILNGYEGSAPSQVDEVMEDWFALIAKGHVVAAMGNSDTHKLSTSLAGYPRNFIPVKDDRASAFNADDVIDSIRKKRSFLTTAPFLELSAGAAHSGDLAPASGGHITVHVRVRAASWVKVQRLRLYVGGEVAATRPLEGKGVVRFDEDVVLDATTDTYVVARVDGDEALPCVVGDAGEHGGRPDGGRVLAYPLAVTNPLFVDGDGDGKWTTAGLHYTGPRR